MLVGGRRSGKTTAMLWAMLDAMARGQYIWYSALTNRNVSDVWREMLRRTRQVTGRQVSKTLREIEFPNGGRLAVRSLEEYDNLRGTGLHAHFIDEYAYVHPDAWPLVLMPMLLERQGGAWFASSPYGLNHFHQLVILAASDPDHAVFRLTGYDNPIVSADEMERVRRSVPERVWQQEYMGEFLSDGGAVFRNLAACAVAQPQVGPIPGHEYVIGVDLAKQNDYTVLAVLDATLGAVVYLDRFSQIDYTLQLERLKALNDRFRPSLIVIERNTGEMFIELCYLAGLPVSAFATTVASKTRIIEALAVAFEREALRIIPDGVLLGELQAYSMKRLPGGTLRYSAPAGMHDDTVMAVALAYEYGALIQGAVSVVR